MIAKRATLTADAVWEDLVAVIAGDYKGPRVSHTLPPQPTQFACTVGGDAGRKSGKVGLA